MESNLGPISPELVLVDPELRNEALALLRRQAELAASRPSPPRPFPRPVAPRALRTVPAVAPTAAPTAAAPVAPTAAVESSSPVQDPQRSRLAGALEWWFAALAASTVIVVVVLAVAYVLQLLA